MIPEYVLSQQKLYGTQAQWIILGDIIYFTNHVYTGTSVEDLTNFIRLHEDESERIRFEMMNDPF